MSARPRLHNLPTQLTSFIGREREIAEVKRLLPTTGLLTLTGAGGSGKTRVALRLAADLLDDYRDGVWVIQLASLSEPTLVPAAVASALGLRESGSPLTESVAGYLQPRSVLLILDNCEHLLQACTDLVGALLQACPSLRILATSREPLGIAGELTYRVPSLSVPDLTRLPPPEALAQFEAVRLFVERAAFNKPGFRITQSNDLAVAQIVHRLDGIPLAIELAAARIKALTAEQIAVRLDDRFRLLTGGSRTALPRQQTLRATLDWSHDLLSEPERTLLRRLSVFAGGFALQAAEKICGGGGIDANDILDLLTRLVDRSLVAFDDVDGQARYHLLETVRQYGQDRLLESSEADDMRRNHRQWYLDFAEQANMHLRAPEQDTWLDRLEIEHDNLRAAVAWSKMDENGLEPLIQLTGALGWFWFMNGHWSQGRQWLEDALSTEATTEPSLLYRVVSMALNLAYQQGDFKRMRELIQDAGALSKKLGDKESSGRVRIGMSILARESGQLERAIALCEEGVALLRELGDKWRLAFAFAQLADSVRAGGDFERAASMYAESARLYQEVGDKWRLSVTLRDTGIVFLRQRDYDRAAASYAHSIRLRDPAKNRWALYQNLEGLACVACGRGHYRKAAILFGAAKPLQESLESRRDHDYQLEVDQYLNATRTSLGEHAFAAAWAEGRAMTLEQAVGYALTAVESAEPTGQRRQSKKVMGDPLTARERDVVRLVARGLTNREIAAALVVSGRTADAHVQNILNKLGFNSRAQIAAWAVERGLKGDSEV